MQSLPTLFADYATYHKTSGNKWCHRIGIPMIILSGFGMLARVPIAGPVNAALVLIAIAEVVYLMLEWRLAILMLLVSIGLYFAGAAIPIWINVALFVLGWIFQFVGHSVYEHRQPAFLKNGLHLLVGPLWLLNDVVPVAPASPEVILPNR